MFWLLATPFYFRPIYLQIDDFQIYAIYDWLAYNENKETAPTHEPGDYGFHVFCICEKIILRYYFVFSPKFIWCHSSFVSGSEKYLLFLFWYSVKYEMGWMELGKCHLPARGEYFQLWKLRFVNCKLTYLWKTNSFQFSEVKIFNYTIPSWLWGKVHRGRKGGSPWLRLEDFYCFVSFVCICICDVFVFCCVSFYICICGVFLLIKGGLPTLGYQRILCFMFCHRGKQSAFAFVVL